MVPKFQYSFFFILIWCIQITLGLLYFSQNHISENRTYLIHNLFMHKCDVEYDENMELYQKSNAFRFNEARVCYLGSIGPASFFDRKYIE